MNNSPPRYPTQYLVRVGSMGQVGRFNVVDALRFERAERVICRTARGLEIGEVLGPVHRESTTADGALLRKMTIQDDLLLTRIEKNREKAYQACNDVLQEQGLPQVLVDVEHLFDGRSIYFYFLGDVTPELDELTRKLCQAYEAESQIRQFGELLSQGCGPGCGTEEMAGSGCQTGGCSSCALAGGCGSS